jgi:two-component system OmpR family sensor kinase/two-component system sensor histidine kinase QseC
MRSIRLRLLVSLLAALALAALAMSALAYRSVLHESHALFDYQLRQMALSLRDQGEIPSDQASAFADEQFDFVVQIWTADGRSIYSTRAHRELPERAVLGFADINVNGEAWRTFSVAAVDRVIQVAQPRAIRESLAARAALRSVLPLALLAPLLGIAVWWLVALSLRPLNRVAHDVGERDAESLRAVPLGDLPDEARPLVAALNALLQRLGVAFDTQRAFLSDAAHELRSPLTALKLQIATLRRAPDEVQRQAALDALSAGVERATRLVEQLLTLARSEPGAQQPPLQTLQLGELVRQALADSAPYAASRGSTLELDVVDGDVAVEGDPHALSALARNLVDNAVRYAPPGARVAVSVGRGDSGAPLLRVDDNGPGIPPAERERVFDRFVRRDEALGEPGSGLGLAIVRSVAQRHDATVRLDQSPLGGLRVEVRFNLGLTQR